MTIEQTFTAITITLTIINAALIYFNLRHSRKKDFQDKLFQLKLDAYKEMNDACYSSIKRLDIESTPFVQIYDIKDKGEWTKYCENNMGEQFQKGFELLDLAYKYTFILPPSVVNKLHEFSNYCISFVTMTYHFDTGLIIDNQERLWDLYTDLTNEFRKDLNIEIIDGSLRQRISSKI